MMLHMDSNIPDYILRALKELEMQVRRDDYNLTRDDHDAINVQIQLLRDFISNRYEHHGK